MTRRRTGKRIAALVKGSLMRRRTSTMPHTTHPTPIDTAFNGSLRLPTPMASNITPVTMNRMPHTSPTRATLYHPKVMDTVDHERDTPRSESQHGDHYEALGPWRNTVPRSDTYTQTDKPHSDVEPCRQRCTTTACPEITTDIEEHQGVPHDQSTRDRDVTTRVIAGSDDEAEQIGECRVKE
jgi:hypothetical protein